MDTTLLVALPEVVAIGASDPVFESVFMKRLFGVVQLTAVLFVILCGVRGVSALIDGKRPVGWIAAFFIAGTLAFVATPTGVTAVADLSSMLTGIFLDSATEVVEESSKGPRQ